MRAPPRGCSVLSAALRGGGLVPWRCAALLVSLAAVPVTAQAPMTPAGFAAELERISGQISDAPAGVVPAVRVPAVWTVETDGQRFEMPALWLRNAIESARRDGATWPSQRAALLTRLAALRDEAQSLDSLAATSSQPADAEAARSVLSGVLAGPEFEGMNQRSAVTVLRQRVSQWLMRTWDRLSGGTFAGRTPAVVFAWISVLVALAALGTWLVRMVLRRDGGGALPIAATPMRRRSARAWARDAARSADAREAVRCAYRATIARLEEEGVWRSDETRTPREYLRCVPPDHRRRGVAIDVTRRFEEVWYGARMPTDEDRSAVLARLEEMGCLPAD